jgi:hypothetical protein
MDTDATLPDNSSVRQTVDATKYADIKSFVHKNRPKALTKEERLDILRIQGFLRHTPTNFDKLQAMDTSELIASMLGRGKATVQSVWRDYINEGAVIVATTPANYSARQTRVPRTTDIVSAVQTFVREKREIRARVVAKDVMAFLSSIQVISYDATCKTSANSALRSVQNFLIYCGYQRGVRKGRKSLALTEANTILRDEYVRFICGATQHVNWMLRRRIVYLDESFVHHHYAKHDISLYDPTDDNDVQPNAKHKGQRYCFIGAIVDGGDFASQFVCYDKFVGGKRQTKDYHGMFDHKYFVAWFQGLLNELAKQHLGNCIIIMDNAKYHKVRPADTPRFGWKKADLQGACARFGVEVDPCDLKSAIWSKLKPHVALIQPVVCSMAEAAGHQVVYSPPHHSNLQPIETVWAVVKSEVGRQYDVNTSFADVGKRLDSAIGRLASRTIIGCIRKSERDLLHLYKHLTVIDNDNYHEEPRQQGHDSSDDDSSDTQSSGSVSSN